MNPNLESEEDDVRSSGRETNPSSNSSFSIDYTAGTPLITPTPLVDSAAGDSLSTSMGSNENIPDIPNDDARLFECTICDIVFGEEEQYKKHLGIKHV